MIEYLDEKEALVALPFSLIYFSTSGGWEMQRSLLFILITLVCCGCGGVVDSANSSGGAELLSVPDVTKDGLSLVDYLTSDGVPTRLGRKLAVYGTVADCLPTFGQPFSLDWPIVGASQMAEFAPGNLAVLPVGGGGGTVSGMGVSQQLTPIDDRGLRRVDAAAYARADEACRQSTTGIGGITTHPVFVVTGELRRIRVQAPLGTRERYGFMAERVDFVRQMGLVELASRATVQQFVDHASDALKQ